MRRVLGLAAGAVVLVLAAVYALASTVVPALLQQANAEPQTCLATAIPVGNGDGSGQAAALGPEQRQIAGAIIAHGQQRQLPARAWQVAIQAGKTESNLRNLSYGDRDSVGIFQMRTSMGWGTPQQLQNVDYQVNKFYDVLLQVPGWEQMRPGMAAQRVERSAYPQRYHQWEGLALSLITDQAGLENPSGCAPAGDSAGSDAPNPAAKQAIEAALNKQGAPYVWGAKGPERFDCSGLVQWAYKQAGVTVPAGSWMQYDAGQQVPLTEAQPGDLVFWASSPDEPGSIHHVAMYLGDGQIVQAPYSEEPVQTSSLRDNGITSDEELMTTAVRPGVGA